MVAPKYIAQGLKAIDSQFFAVFNPCIKERKNMSFGRGRWQIRKWRGTCSKRLDLWDTNMSEVIMTICREEVTEDGLVDAGYEEVDWRVVTAIRESNYWKAGYKKKIAEMDWRNEKRERQAQEQLEYESKYAAQRIWRNYHEPQVCLSGKDWVR